MTANTARPLADMEGEIHLPGTAGYDAGRSGYNLLVEHRPAMVVVPSSVRDVMRAIAHARHQGLPVAIQATGHGLAPGNRRSEWDAGCSPHQGNPEHR